MTPHSRRMRDWVLRRSRTSPAPPPAQGPAVERQLADDLDLDYYQRRYSDLAHLSPQELREHYASFGRQEGRRCAPPQTTTRSNSDTDPQDLPPILVVLGGSTFSPVDRLGQMLLVDLTQHHQVTCVRLGSSAVEADLRCDHVIVAEYASLADADWAVLAEDLYREHHPVFAVTTSLATLPLATALERCHVPTVALLHDLTERITVPGGLSTALTTLSDVVVPSAFARETLLGAYDEASGREIAVLAPGPLPLLHTSTPQASATPRSMKPDLPVDRLATTDLHRFLEQLSPTSFLVVGSGSFCPQDGADLFVQTASRTAMTNPDLDVVFAWLGGQDDRTEPNYVDAIHEYIRRSPAVRSIYLLDLDPSASALWTRADAALLTARQEAIPTWSVHAAAAGVPTVAFAGGSAFASWLADTSDVDDLAVPYLDTEEAAHTLVRLVLDAEYRESTREHIAPAAASHFNRDRYAQQVAARGADAAAAVLQSDADLDTIVTSGRFSPELFSWIRPIPPQIELVHEYLRRVRATHDPSRTRSGLLVRRPAPGFNPLTYAELAPDYSWKLRGDPFADWIRSGYPPGPWWREVITPHPPGAIVEPRPRVLVHGHFHYPELVTELLDRLTVNATAPSLLLTTTSEANAAELRSRIAEHPYHDLRIDVVRNSGRNLGALFTALPAEEIMAYDLLLHVHGKRSPHADGAYGRNWRHYLLENLVGGEHPMLDQIVGTFAADPRLGLVSAEDPNLNDWDFNSRIAPELARRVGLSDRLPTHFDFPIGASFWARPQALGSIFEARLTFAEYPPEPVPFDGTMLHTLERILPFAVEAAGYTYRKVLVPGICR